MVMRVGIIGLSEGNGHPFSFSAIINGYNHDEFSKSGWDGILAYLSVKEEAKFGIDDVKVVSAWTQDINVTKTLCLSCNIETPAETLDELINNVDVVIIARDDYETHFSIAKPCLEAGKLVFVDKPLTLDEEELAYFEPYLMSGQLVSGSGFRYAQELDRVRNDKSIIGKVKFIQAAVLNDMPKYGIHMLEAVAGLGFGTPISVTKLTEFPACFHFELPNSISFSLSCLGAVGKTFHIGIYGENGHFQADIHDNFSAFRRSLKVLFKSFREKTLPYDPTETIGLMKILIKANEAEVGEKLYVK